MFGFLLLLLGVGTAVVLGSTVSTKSSKNDDKDLTGTSDPKKFADPWFATGDMNDSFDYKLLSTPANGSDRISAIESKIATSVVKHPSPSMVFNPGAFALIDGVKGLNDQLTKVSKDYVALKKAEKEKGYEILSSVMGLYFGKSVAAWFINWGKGILDSVEKAIVDASGGAYAGHSEQVTADLTAATDCYNTIISKLLIPPVNGFNYGSLDHEYWQDVEIQKNIFCSFADKWRTLGENVRPVNDWFIILTKVSNNPEVQKILIHNTWNDQGLASDSQVYLIASVIAIMNGFNAHDFASELWNKSQGWKRRIDLSQASGGRTENAAVIQFLVLCEDAFSLANKWINLGITKKPSGSSSSDVLLYVPKVGHEKSHNAVKASASIRRELSNRHGK